MTRSIQTRQILAVILLLCLALVPASVRGGAPAAAGTGMHHQECDEPSSKVNYAKPLRDYDCRRVAGWSVLTEQSMWDRDPVFVRRALKRLEAKLVEVKEVLPSHTLARLQTVPIFLLDGTHSPNGGRNSGAQYISEKAPEFNKALDPRMAGSIVLFSAEHFLIMTDFGALKVLVHEMAHAWHLGQWSEKKPEIMVTYQAAMSKGLYRNVRTASGVILEDTYVTRNQLEYFAEVSCIYFCGNDHFPFDRSDLALYDASGYRLMKHLWGAPVTSASR